MYGLHQTLTRERKDGLSWRITIDRRTGDWMPTLVVVGLDKAFKCYPQMILRALNGTSLAVRSQMYARQHARQQLSAPVMDYILFHTINMG